MNRRGFFRAVGAAVLGMALALRMPEQDESYLPPLEDRETGISMRFIQHFDIQTDRLPRRFDAYWVGAEQFTMTVGNGD